MRFPALTPRPRSRETLDTFGGYNHNLRIGENEFYDMKNMTSQRFPVLSVRPPRGLCAADADVRGMISRDGLCYIDGSALVIKNTSADGILSITDIKVTYKAADSAAQAASAEPALMTMSAGEAAEESIFLVSRDIGQMALASMMAVQEPEVPTEPEEPTEPEIFTPGLLTMKVNKTSARVGQKVQVTITTSADVRYLTINGQKLTAYKNIRGGYTRSWTVTLTAKEAGEMEIAVVAYDSKDVASEAVTTTVKVTAKNWINGKF